ncbi:26S proteasome non-ATPase regulatory subunit Nin1/mts3 family protein [Babesia divergens]|uniref:26S proteasome non-ATPase regulatory subunit Nin1/mts3 family protein n=1 Tax=Babesia divergens TaxID=32595 RepID=A0AAD9LEK8_BABDI|nr:26S proteasome non-ATPase regulatory subunit Nin1/mts3 family protein [Babesia divergens]
MSTEELESRVLALRETFAAASADPSALNACVERLAPLKQLLTIHRLQNSIPSNRFWLLSREVHEIGALVSIHGGDVDSFECFYSQLYLFYFDYSQVCLHTPVGVTIVQLMERSERMDLILGIRLLQLLTENRIGDFYMLLELIPHDLRNSINISYVVDLERSMMEGNLARLIGVNHTAPCEYYKTLSDKLADTARSKIAASIEVSYPSLRMDVVISMLQLQGVNVSLVCMLPMPLQEMFSFVAYYNQCKAIGGTFSTVYVIIFAEGSHVQWHIDGDRIVFVSEEVSRCSVSSREMLVHSLDAIEELEKIV